MGFAFDRFLIYGTGGFAYGSVNDSLTVTTGTGALFARGNRNEIATGYTYGGGVEYALPATSFLNVFKSSAVTIKAEYLHYDLGDRSFVVDASAETQRFGNEGDLVRAGINYKF